MKKKTIRKYNPVFKPRKPKQSRPKYVWGFDIETTGKKNDFVLAVFTCVEYNETCVCDTKEQVKEFIDSLNPLDNIIVATNLGFDFFGVIGLDESQLFRQQERNNILYAIKYKNPTKSYKGYLMFYDTVRYMACSVEKLGQIVGIPKLPHPTCFGKRPQTKKEKQELLSYCHNDAQISQRFFKRFIYDYCYEKGLQIKTTISATSMDEFRTYYLKKQIRVESPIIHQCCFQSYKGGRVEVFQRGTFRNVQYYDINSLYPSQMCKQLPDPNHSYYVKQCSLWHIMNREGVCYIEGYQEYRYIPLLCVKHEKKLVFPTGELKGYFTFIELCEALTDGLHLYTIGEGVIYTRTDTFLKQFVEDKYRIRLQQKKNNDPMEVTTKLIMNGNYGKYGQKYETQSKIVSIHQLTRKMVLQATKIEELSHEYFRIDEPSTQPPTHSFPIWASYITAYARLTLWKLLRQYENRLIYCDTDSLFLTDGAHIPNSSMLGELKHEGDFIYGTFARPKMYGLVDSERKETIKIKGMKSKIGYTEMKQVLLGKKLTEQHFVKLRTALNSKPHHTKGVLTPNQIIEKEKGFNPNDTKRDWNNTLFNETVQEFSHPLHLTESDYT